MENKYKDRAIELLVKKQILLNKDLNTHFNLNLTRDTHVATVKYIVTTMCELAEEVEKSVQTRVIVDVYESIKQESLYTKEQVEELLQKQRELCAKKAVFKCQKDSDKLPLGQGIHLKPLYYTIDKDSIKNAKLKIE